MAKQRLSLEQHEGEEPLLVVLKSRCFPPGLVNSATASQPLVEVDGVTTPRQTSRMSSVCVLQASRVSAEHGGDRDGACTSVGPGREGRAGGPEQSPGRASAAGGVWLLSVADRLHHGQQQRGVMQAAARDLRNTMFVFCTSSFTRCKFSSV